MYMMTRGAEGDAQYLVRFFLNPFYCTLNDYVVRLQ
jgi:hypothetical protein